MDAIKDVPFSKHILSAVRKKGWDFYFVLGMNEGLDIFVPRGSANRLVKYNTKLDNAYAILPKLADPRSLFDMYYRIAEIDRIGQTPFLEENGCKHPVMFVEFDRGKATFIPPEGEKHYLDVPYPSILEVIQENFGPNLNGH